MASDEPRRDRRLLVGGLLALFALSALADPRGLALAWLGALVLFRRGAVTALRRLLVAVVPVSAGLSLASVGFTALVAGRPVALGPLLALNLRTTLLAFLTFSVLARVKLMRALAPWPVASRLLAIVLGQIHALRLLVTESSLGLRSRLVRKPSATDVLRGAGGVTGALFVLSARNSREVADALRSRGV